MGKLQITLHDIEQDINSDIITDGYILIYLGDDGHMKITGKFDTKILMPLLTKVILEKMAK